VAALIAGKADDAKSALARAKATCADASVEYAAATIMLRKM
jgi:hypothetical protein